ncbi:MAG: class I SAM-dependent methyltransferase [Anaerolineae bacterium]
MKKVFYQMLYRYASVPWDTGARSELVALVESGRIRPGRAIDLGSGTASNCIYLAQHGFDVTGVDFAPAAIEKGQALADEVGVSVGFIVDDLTDLKHVYGTFDLLVDYGTFDDLRPQQRDLYMRNVLPLTRPGSLFLLYAHEWAPRWWERPFYSSAALELGEAEARFSPYFRIEEIARESELDGFPRGYAVYLMTRTIG